MTDLGYFVDLLQGESRISAFRAGIRAVVRPGDRVLDLGCGLGTYAFFAARAGAAKVWAVERDSVIHVAEALVAANGLSERVVCMRADAAEAALPSGIDVLVFEDFPSTLLDAKTHALLARVHANVMAEDGTMVPCAARLSVAPVQSEPQGRRVAPLPASGAADGLDWSPLHDLLVNHPRRGFVAPGELLAPPLRSARLPLHPLPAPDAMTVEGGWRAGAQGTIHALALWFDLEIARGIWLSNEPRERPEPWGQVLLPLAPPLEVRPDDRVEIAVRRETLPSGAPGWLVWRASIGGAVRQGHEFAGLALGPEDLRGEGHAPSGEG